MAYRLFALLKRLWVACGEPMPTIVRGMRRYLSRWFPVRVPGSFPVSYRRGRSHPLTPDIAVIIPCHNYGRFLAEAIESVLTQSLPPAQIIVVDDASEDETMRVAASFAGRGVRAIRIEAHDVAAARNAGALQTSAPYLVFLDADDKLPHHYLERCREAFDDPAVAIVYGNMHEYGERQRVIRTPPFDRASLLRSNYISSHAMIRRQAYDLVGGYRSLHNAHEDWDLYRRILRFRWTAKKADTFVHYRMHGESMLHRHQRNAISYCTDAALLTTPITIFSPFCGRTAILPRFTESLQQLSIEDRSLLTVHFHNTSADPAFDDLLRSALNQIPCGRMIYTSAPHPAHWGHTAQSLVEHRVRNGRNAQYYYELAVVKAYNHLLISCDTEYALVLEDDVLPAPDALRRMLQTVQADTAAVVCHYPCHLQGYSMVWRANRDGTVTHFPKRRHGVEEVGGSGFGCSLLRMSAFRTMPIHTRVYESPPRWYDYNAFDHLRTQGRVLCNWDIEVEHVRTERFLNPTAPFPPA